MPEPPKQPGKGYRWRRYPWTTLRAEFVTNPDLSLAELCRRHRIPTPQVQRRAQNEGWKELREAFARELLAKAQGKAIAEVVEVARVSATSLLTTLRTAREAVLKATLEDLENPSSRGAILESRETKFEGDPKAPKRKTVTRRVRAHHQGRGAETILKTEAVLLARLLGGGSDADQRVVLE